MTGWTGAKGPDLARTIRSSRGHAADLPAGWREPRLFLLLDLPVPTVSHHAGTMIRELPGLIRHGSYGPGPHGSASLVVSGTDDEWAASAARLDRLPGERPALQFRLPGPDTVLRARDSVPATRPDGTWVWEAVLHGDPNGPERPAAPDTLRRFEQAVVTVEGAALTEKAVVTGSLTYLPVLLPAGHQAPLALARYNPLRILRVASVVSLR